MTSLLRKPRDLLLTLSAVWLVLIVAGAVLVDILPLSEAQDIGIALSQPTLLPPGVDLAHPLGTDKLGLDLLGGVLLGARVSLIVGSIAVAIGILLGGGLGLLAGYYRGPLEKLIGIISDTVLAIPGLVLLTAVMTIMKPTVVNIAVTLALLSIPAFLRISRALTIGLVRREFVQASIVLGARDGRIMLREIMPNLLPTLFSYGFIVFAMVIVAEASLSFLGVGIQRPSPTWGNIIAAGQDDIRDYPHVVLVPAAALFLTVYSLNRLGEYLRGKADGGATRGN